MFSPALVLLLSLSGHAATPPQMRPVLETFQFPIAEQCFPSGLHVVVQQDPSAPLVQIQTLVEGGSSADPAGAEGAAHLLEHLWFRSQPTGGLSVADALREAGAAYNGATEQDITRYTTVVPRENIGTVIHLEGKRLLNPLVGITEDTVKLERRVLLAEQATHATQRRAAYAVMQDLYPQGHPYAHPDESATSLERVSLDGLRRLAARGRPDATTMVLVGGYDINTLSRLVVDSLPRELLEAPPGQAPRTCSPRLASAEPPPEPAHPHALRTIEASILHPQVGVAWSVPAVAGADAVRLEIIAGMVDGFIDDRRRMRPGAKPGEGGSSCEVAAGRKGSEIFCSWPLGDDEDPAASVRQAIGRIDLLWGPSYRSSLDRSLEYVRRWRTAALLETLELGDGQGEGRAELLADAAHTTGRLAVLGDQTDTLASVQAAELITEARPLIRLDRAATYVLKPGAEEPLRVSAELLDSSWSPDAGQGRAFTTALDPRSLAPDLSRITDVTLKNGMRVVVLPVGEAPLARAMLWFKGGPLNEPAAGLDALTRDSLAFDAEYQRLAGSVTPEAASVLSRWSYQVSTNGMGFGISGPSGNIEQQLYLLSRRADSVQPDGGLYKRALADLTRERADRARTGSWVAASRALIRLFPEHPLARMGELYLRDPAEQPSFAAIKSWAARVYQPSNGTLIVVGRVSPERVLELANTWFGSWNGAAAPITAAPRPPAPPDQQVLVLGASTAQTRVSLRCQAGDPAPNDQEADALLVGTWERLAGQALRGERGVSYVVNGSRESWSGGAGTLGLAAIVDTDAAGLAARVFLDLPKMTVESRLPGAAVERTRRDVAGAWLRERVSSLGVLELLTDTIALDRDPRSLAARGERLAAVGPKELAARASRCAGHEVLTLRGPEEAVRASVQVALTARSQQETIGSR